MQDFKSYEGGNNLYLVDNIDNKQLLKAIFIDTCKDLSNKKIVQIVINGVNFYNIYSLCVIIELVM